MLVVQRHPRHQWGQSVSVTAEPAHAPSTRGAPLRTAQAAHVLCASHTHTLLVPDVRPAVRPPPPHPDSVLQLHLCSIHSPSMHAILSLILTPPLQSDTRTPIPISV